MYTVHWTVYMYTAIQADRGLYEDEQINNFHKVVRYQIKANDSL